jgi:hypothetical protein
VFRKTWPWACLGMLVGAVAMGGEREFSAGALATISAANGEPANDIPGFGVQVRYAWNERWAVGAALLRSEYDFETPAEIVGITQSPAVEPVDVLAESNALQGWVERTIRPGAGATRWFVGAGLAAASVDVPDVAGPRADGGQFDLRTDAGTEIIVTAFAGVRRAMGERWYVEFRVHANQHLADWQVEDRVSGASGAIDDYASFGGHVAVGMRW